MLLQGRVFCDLCNQHMGQLWNESPAARDLLPAPDFRVCDDCHSAALCTCGQAGCWFARRAQCFLPFPKVGATAPSSPCEV